MNRSASVRTIAFGPCLPEFGSWNWIGAELANALSDSFDITIFEADVPRADVVVFVKFKPPLAALQQIAQRSRIIYCPVDLYGSAAEIDEDWNSLRLCELVIVHCQRLRKYFGTYTRVEYLDHHLKFVATPPDRQPLAGPILWTGQPSNLPPVVEWVNRHGLPDELVLLTNLDSKGANPGDYGFKTKCHVQLHQWTPQSHRDWAARSRLAIDIKGDDFRGRHKPPTKAYDFVSSGLPLAMNANCSSAEALRTLGFTVADPRDWKTWQSTDYWQQTQAIATRLRHELTLQNIAEKFLNMIPIEATFLSDCP